ncbi:MAG: acetate/propionate family kinase [Gemmataceae bacterium]|nr:acetate/propionate family kinase [Gemmata sp.]MDW8196858.1 acetate/propionate family kinase [Gemmataceae bacterium]
MPDAILVLNAGSSGWKFALYAPDSDMQLDRGHVAIAGPNTEPEVLDAILARSLATLAGGRLVAVGHRVVHGGMTFASPVRLDDAVMSELTALIPLAPLHQPPALAGIRTVQARLPAVPQVACFDTAFHRSQPEVAQWFGLPRQWTARGIRRYGFHGLSYEFIATVLPTIDPAAAAGRTIVAHLGHGASLCALRAGRSLATTMSFTPADGLVMSTRCGSLDPGVIIYLAQQHGLSMEAIERLILHESGLRGVSGISGDMRELLASSDPRAAEAIDLFIYRISREIGSLAAALGGLDALVFTGGIGENAASIRERIVAQARWLGEFRVHVIATDEERMIAQHTRRVLGLATAS